MSAIGTIDLADATVWRWVLPMQKALPDADSGSIIHGGVAQDECLDLQKDVLRTSDITKSFGYLTKHGKFNWDHASEDIGDVFGCRMVSPSEAYELFGATIEKSGTAVWGNVYPIVDASLAHQDLKSCHHRMRAGARLGYSLDGVAVRRPGGDLVQVWVPKVAITGQPINPNTTCQVLAKSLGAALDNIKVSDRDMPEVVSLLERGPDMILDSYGDGGTRVDTDEVRISKGLLAALVRVAFPTPGRRAELPPLGKLKEALQARGR